MEALTSVIHAQQRTLKSQIQKKAFLHPKALLLGKFLTEFVSLAGKGYPLSPLSGQKLSIINLADWEITTMPLFSETCYWGFAMLSFCETLFLHSSWCLNRPLVLGCLIFKVVAFNV